MKWTGLNQLREEFLSFFESKAHLRYPSAPLVPKDDASLLLINSGMAPLKKYFLGLETPPSKRMTTCQKCIRTPDIEGVGKTSRHGTFFEMLGNFSFGDYFKEEATTWAWEFFTERLEIPKDRIWVSIYEDDNEAFDIWTKHRGVDPSRIVRLGKEDNFWEIGSGPCGPCSEIYFDRGEEYGCDHPNCGIGNCDCDRYMEVWNLVFTQFNSDGEGNYTPLEHPNIDTGMGLERLACVMQGVDNIFEVDTFQNIMNKISEITKIKYKTDAKTDVSMRVITDHIRSTVFMVGDGVIPSNEGRGYVLRRLLRRAARHGYMLGVKEPFLYNVCDTVIEENKGIYPELTENKEYIRTIIKTEEERFSKTIQQGMELLVDIIGRISDRNTERVIDGKDAFQLYDTFGFPIDLTREIAADQGVLIDEEGFVKHMQEQRERARKAHEEAAGVGWEADVLADMNITDTFVGYDVLATQTEILAIVKDGALTEELIEGEDGVIVVAETPFYAESGGQVGDKGEILLGDSMFKVADTKKSPTGHILHISTVTKGKIQNKATVTAKVDAERRGRIMRNHTAVHLLQAVLRKNLGDHVHQAGSYVSDDLARFDFTHFSAVAPEQLQEVENQVNDLITQSINVNVEEMSMEDAKGKGAMALFGDKYSDMVRVCMIGDASMELCGGTHIKNTAQIGVFKITAENSVAAGVRRIEIVTGKGVLKLLDDRTQKLKGIGQFLKVNSVEELLTKAQAIFEELGELKAHVNELEAQLAGQKTKGFEENLVKIGSVELATLAIVGNIAPLQEQADKIKDKKPNIVGVMIAMGEENAAVLVFAGKDAVKAGINCGKLVKEIASVAGGSGGGRPDNAKGGIPDLSRVDEALAAVKGIVESHLG